MAKAEIDQILISNYLKLKEWGKASVYFKEKFIILHANGTEAPDPLLITQNTVDAFSSILVDISDASLTAELIALMSELFRALRNCVPFNENLAKNDAILHNTHKILSNLLGCNITNKEDCVRMILQFLTNLHTANINADLWELFHTIVIQLCTEPDYSYHATALLYNIVLLHRDLVVRCDKLYTHVLEAIDNDIKNEYNLFLLELFMQDEHFMNQYESFDGKLKLVILSSLHYFVSANDKFQFSAASVPILTTKFKNKFNCIFKSKLDSVEPPEIVLCLEVLAMLCADERYRQQLQDDSSLLMNCASLLLNIHTLGIQAKNEFTPLTKLSEVTSIDSKVLNNTLFGFKADLIRFLGNVCWKNEKNQDQLRQLNCISLLLDCCNIDARNPFIMQWTILALRNLCEGNPANQAVIAGMTRKGVVDNSTLQEMGLTLHDDGSNRITIGPLPDRNS